MGAKSNQPRVLLYDLETSYLIIGAWGIYETNAAVVLQDWQILCFAYKWLGDKSVHMVSQDDFSNYVPGKLNDLNVVKRLHALFDEADVVVAHNGNSFDQKKSQARMMVHGMKPPSPYQQVDTKSEMKKVAAHTSNKLDDLNRALGIESKLDAGGISTWTGCMNGDKASWRKMKRYNRGDVRSLEELYLLELPWMKTHPNMALMSDRPDACPRCLSTRLYSKGFKFTNSSRYRDYQCQDCGARVKGRRAEKDFDKPEFVS